ncbi:MAG: hypothetical protein LBV71_16185 [Prevotella sp.]|jgi:hypothetical protein|nr:hypothetical protein [Prevotella sp.]
MKKLFTLTLLVITLFTATTTFTSCSKDDDVFQLNGVMEDEIDITYLNQFESDEAEYEFLINKYNITPELRELLTKIGGQGQVKGEITDVNVIKEWVNKDKPIHFKFNKNTYNPKNYHIIKYNHYYHYPMNNYTEDGEYDLIFLPIDVICKWTW